MYIVQENTTFIILYVGTYYIKLLETLEITWRMKAILRSSTTSFSAGKAKADEEGGAVNSSPPPPLPPMDSVEDSSWLHSMSVLLRRLSASCIPSPHSSTEK